MARRRTESLSRALGIATWIGLARKRALTRLVISLERLIPLLWPPVGLICVTAGFSAAGGWTLVPAWLHWAGLVIGAAALSWLILRLFRRFRPASGVEAERRLETANPVHRPLTAVRDRLALGRADSATQGLWAAHRRRMARRVAALRTPKVAPDMPRHDPLALRFAAVCVLALGFAIGGGRAPENLLAALTPDAVGAERAKTVLEAWITPPAYTGLPPLFLDRTAAPGAAETPEATLRAPANSRLLARYHLGGAAAMALGDTLTPFQRINDSEQQLETALLQSGRLEIRDDGAAIAAWSIAITPDAPPEAAFATPPAATLRGALKIHYLASDDYGLTGLALHLRRADTDETEIFDLPPAGRSDTRIEETIFRDLSAHRWAGLPVVLMLRARDAAGQSGDSESATLTLPVRQFNHPAARAVAEQRRKLLADPKVNRKPVVIALRALMINPRLYDSDLAVHLMLSVAAADLALGDDAATVTRNQELLWATALRIEEGQLSSALSRLRQVQERLQEALANGADESEIQALMDELEQAMAAYLDAMQRQALERMQQGEEMQIGENPNRLDQHSLSDMLDRARELSQAGARERARDMLSQLQNMLENLQMDTQSAGAQGQRQSNRMLDQLGEMLERQQQLRDQTFERQQRAPPNAGAPGESSRNPGRQGERGQRPNSGQGSPGQRSPGQGSPGQMSPGLMGDADLAALQEQIRKQLQQLQQRLGQSGGGAAESLGPLGEAEGAMRNSESALGGGNRPGALNSQDEALDHLLSGVESIMEEMMRRSQQQGGNGQGVSEAGLDGEQTDPLGRGPTGRWGRSRHDVVPDESVLQKSRQILDELRRRSGQRHRGPVERDYLDRLLQQF